MSGARGRAQPAGRGELDLTEGELEVVGFLPYASNYTLLARLVREDAGPMTVVYKPRRGETPLWDFEVGTLCRREVAACEVAAAAGWGFVPPTVLRQGPLGDGAVQLFIEHDSAVTAFELMETHEDDLKLIAAFDVVVNNADRKAGHVLIDGESRIWAVDHGICFHAEPKLRTVIWDFEGLPLPPEATEGVERLVEAMKGAPGERIRELLAPAEVDALEARAAGLLETQVFPPPGPGRPFPWPLV